MLKNKVWQQLAPLLIFLVFVLIIHWQLKFSLIFFFLGAILGSFLLDLDQLIYCYFQSPHEFTSQRFKRLWQLKRYQEALMLLGQTGDERSKLVFHSVLFQLVLLVVSFFVLTSSGSFLGKGLVLGLLLHSLTDQLRDWKGKGEISRWFWSFQEKPSLRWQKVYLAGVSFVFIIFSLLWH